jgi:MFS family permease
MLSHDHSPASSPAAERTGLRARFPALGHPNYRRWYAGQLVSLLGSWVQTTAQGFLVFELTGSSAYLGYVVFAAGLPAWLFTLLGGVVADRLPRRWLLVGTQAAMMIPAFVLAALTFLGAVQPWHILILAFAVGVVTAFDAPARQSFVVELVGHEDLTNAIALNATIFHSATTLGPAAAGLLYTLVGPAWCFAINGVSFLAVIAALLSMRLTPRTRGRSGSALGELVAGLRFVGGHTTIRSLLVGMGAVSVFGMGLMALMPAWAVKVLHGHAGTNGLLLSARGLGSLAAALTVASLGRITYRGRLLTTGSIALPVTLLIFGLVRSLPAAMVALFCAGLGVIIFYNMCNALVQGETPDELRGRVMGIYSLTFFGLMPLGSLLAGTLAAHLGEPTTVLLDASALLALALLGVLLVPSLRRLR